MASSAPLQISMPEKFMDELQSTDPSAVVPIIDKQWIALRSDRMKCVVQPSATLINVLFNSEQCCGNALLHQAQQFACGSDDCCANDD